MIGFPTLAVVREDGQEITSRRINYTGGCGIRIYPRRLLQPLGFRPADPDRKRACDTSIFTNVAAANPRMRVEHRHLHDYQIVDWKSPREQLNSYESLQVFRSEVLADPFEALAPFYPAAALLEMQHHYARELVAA
jgi:hypothetical protein